MVIGLLLFAIVLFVISLYLAAGAAPGKSVINNTGDSSVKDQQKFIVVKLPDSCLVPEDYTLDLKVSLRRSKEKAGGGVSDMNRRWYKNQFHGLDEYM